MKPSSAPDVGAVLRDKANDGKMLFTVSNVFDAGAYPGMILEWPDSDSQTGKRWQAFTCQNWEKRWEMIR